MNSCYSCGEVTDVYITEKGYAFVTMADETAADAAIKELNQAVIDGQEINSLMAASFRETNLFFEFLL